MVWKSCYSGSPLEAQTCVADTHYKNTSVQVLDFLLILLAEKFHVAFVLSLAFAILFSLNNLHMNCIKGG